MKLKKCACIEPMYAELPFYDRIAAAARDGFAAVEFWDPGGKDPARIRAEAQAAGVRVAGFNGDGAWSMVDPRHRAAYLDDLKRRAELACRIGAESLTIHSNALGEGGRVLCDYRELAWDVKLGAMQETLPLCAQIGREFGLRLNLEALNTVRDHVGNFLRDTATAALLVREVDSPWLRILFDAYHMAMNGEPILRSLRDYGSWIGHVHAADAPGRHEPGTGSLDFEALFACLEEIGYSGLVGFELFPQTSTAEAVRAIMK